MSRREESPWATGELEWGLVSTVRCSTGGRRERCGGADARALDDRVYRIGRDVFQGFDLAAGPANFHRFHFPGGAKAEVEAQIVLREVTSTAADFAELLYARGANGHARADRSAIAFGADQLEEDAVIAVGVHVFQERGRLVHVQKEDVDVAGVEDVAEGSAARPDSLETSSKVPSRLLRWRRSGSR